MLELQDVTLSLGHDDEARDLLHKVSLVFPKGHLCAIVGPSGCGKSTLLKVIAGLREQTEGGVHWDGRDLSEDQDLDPSEIGYVPQFSIAYELLDVWESVETALRLRVAGLDREERDVRTEAILKEVGLDEIADRSVRVLSGGQRRRLALALEMVTSPALLLADEVTSGLDPKAEQEIVELLRRLANEDDRIVLTVTHSLRHVELYDSVLVLHSGHVVFHGPGRHLSHYFGVENPEQIFSQLAKRPAEKWHSSWGKHRGSYYETEKMAFAGEKPIPPDLLVQSDEEEKSAHEKAERKRREEDAGRSKKSKHQVVAGPISPSRLAPGAISQFFTLLARRWKILSRDRTQVLLHLALIFGFPFLVVIFALDGLPQIQNLSLTQTANPLEQAKETVNFLLQSTKIGSLVSGLVMFQVILLTLMGANNSAREIAGERSIFEKEKLGGVRVSSYVASKAAFLAVLVVVQSAWMAVFVKWICGFPGDVVDQGVLLLLVNAAMSAVCLGISSFMRSAEQASLVSVYLVGFQLPLSGAVLALPSVIGAITRPFIAAYWGWSGVIQTMRETRFYDLVLNITQTELSPSSLCVWVLCTHVVVGLSVAYLGCKRSQWE